MDGMVDFLLRTTNVASAVASSGPELPNIGEFLPPEILFQGTPFAMNRIILVRVLMAVIVMIIFGIGAARAKLVPGRFQSMLEILMDFVRYNIVYEMIGEERGKRYVPMMSTLFLTIFFFNLCALWLLGGILFTLFEIMVAGLQAFIFTVLASVYISESYPEEEEKSAVAVA